MKVAITFLRNGNKTVCDDKFKSLKPQRDRANIEIYVVSM